MVKSIRCIGLLLRMSLICLMIFVSPSCTNKTESIYGTGTIISVSSDKARYNLGDKVIINIAYSNNELSKGNNSFKIEITHLEKMIYEEVLSIQEGSSTTFNWFPPLLDYTGYLVNIYHLKNDNVIDQRNIAVDVSSTWNVFPRYGYLANFDLSSEKEIEEIINSLNRYHLTGFLFYDWQYKHNLPISQTQSKLDESWLNIANKKVYASKLVSYITKLHERNMQASNYNLVYGAYEDYARAHVEMALYKDSRQRTQDKHDLPSTWASDIYLINPLNKDWQNHYLQMENEVLEFLEFDVMHLDTLGNRGTRFDSFGKIINMEFALANFTTFLKNNLNQGIILNFVNEYAKYETFKTKSIDLAYTEVWPDNYPTYSSLKDIIDKDLKNGYASILACYMNYKKESGNFNTSSVLYTEAVILASGGAHLSLGDLGMLSSEYFPNNKLKMSEELVNKMIEYGDFMVAYENLLRGNLKENSTNLSVDNFEYNTLPRAESIWIFSKENKQYKTIQLINLLNRKIPLWRDDNDTSIPPTILTNVKINIPINADKVSSVYGASPDKNGGTSQELDYMINNQILSVVVPQLNYWTMVYIIK